MQKQSRYDAMNRYNVKGGYNKKEVYLNLDKLL